MKRRVINLAKIRGGWYVEMPTERYGKGEQVNLVLKSKNHEKATPIVRYSPCT